MVKLLEVESRSALKSLNLIPPEGSSMILGPVTEDLESLMLRLCLNLQSRMNPDQVIWVCCKLPATRCLRKLESAGINKLRLVDVISKPESSEKPHPNISYCGISCTHILMELGKLLDIAQRPLLVFDSLGAIFSFNDPEMVIKMIRGLNAKISSKSGAVIYSLTEGTLDPVIQNSVMDSMESVLRIASRAEAPTEFSRYLRESSWRQIFGMERPLLYIMMMVLLIVNVFMIIMLMKFVL